MKIIYPLFVSMIFSATKVQAQPGWDRYDITTPAYGLGKVVRLIGDEEKARSERDRKEAAAKRGAAALKDSTDEEQEFTLATNPVLPDNIYRSLSLRERFTYNMVNPEEYSQICGAGRSAANKSELYARLPRRIGEQTWSHRQYEFFSSNRDSVIALIRESMAKGGQMGLNYKFALIDLNAVEAIPSIIALYERMDDPDKKDHDVLTVLLLLMNKNAYIPFMSSDIYRSLYGAKESSYRTVMQVTEALEGRIIRMAETFYHERKK